MRGNFVTSLAVVCLLGAALAGCGSTPPIDDTASNPGDRFGLVAAAPVGQSSHSVKISNAAAANLSSDATNPDAINLAAAVDLAAGLPYVRSGPHKVSPFPLALKI